jgi:hypothetical protein
MGDFREDRADLLRREDDVRAQLVELMDTAATLSEFAPDGLIRKPLTEAQREIAVVLNALVGLLDERATEASAAAEPRWEGLADAKLILYNALGYHSLPQLGL